MQVRDVLATTAPGATVLVRVVVGWVFLSEGILKFLQPEALGVGRFAHIGIPRRRSWGRLWAASRSSAAACSSSGFSPGRRR